MDIFEKIAVAKTWTDLDALKQEAWDHPDFNVWSAYVDRGAAINQARSAAVRASMELAPFGETGSQQMRRLGRRLAGAMALAEHDQMAVDAANNASRIAREASDLFQQQCDSDLHVHLHFHNNSF